MCVQGHQCSAVLDTRGTVGTKVTQLSPDHGFLNECPAEWRDLDEFPAARSATRLCWCGSQPAAAWAELTRVERTSVADLFFQNRREWQQELHNLPQDQRAPVNVLLQSLNIQVQDWWLTFLEIDLELVACWGDLSPYFWNRNMTLDHSHQSAALNSF